MDGSAAPFVALIERAGIVAQDAAAARDQGAEAVRVSGRRRQSRRCCPITASR